MDYSLNISVVDKVLSVNIVPGSGVSRNDSNLQLLVSSIDKDGNYEAIGSKSGYTFLNYTFSGDDGILKVQLIDKGSKEDVADPDYVAYIPSLTECTDAKKEDELKRCCELNEEAFFDLLKLESALKSINYFVESEEYARAYCVLESAVLICEGEDKCKGC